MQGALHECVALALSCCLLAATRCEVESRGHDVPTGSPPERHNAGGYHTNLAKEELGAWLALFFGEEAIAQHPGSA